MKIVPGCRFQKYPQGLDKKYIETRSSCVFKGRLWGRWQTKKNEIRDLRERLKKR